VKLLNVNPNVVRGMSNGITGLHALGEQGAGSLEAYLSGQQAEDAMADVNFGK
jgi:hypothetical protein